MRNEATQLFMLTNHRVTYVPLIKFEDVVPLKLHKSQGRHES